MITPKIKNTKYLEIINKNQHGLKIIYIKDQNFDITILMHNNSLAMGLATKMLEFTNHRCPTIPMHKFKQTME